MNPILDVYRDDRLIRHKWSDVAQDGRQLLCLYTALVSDPAARPSSCPPNVAPRWVAYLLPWMDDAGSVEAWPRVVERVAALAPHLHRLCPAAEWRTMAIIIREGVRYLQDGRTLETWDRVATLYERLGRGEDVPKGEFNEAAGWAKEFESEAWSAAEVVVEAAAEGADLLVDVVRASVADRLTAAILSDWEGELGV